MESLESLRKHDLLVALMPTSMINQLIVMKCCLIWLRKLVASCDAMCRLVAIKFNQVALNGFLIVDNFLPKILTEPLHNLYIGK